MGGTQITLGRGNRDFVSELRVGGNVSDHVNGRGWESIERGHPWDQVKTGHEGFSLESIRMAPANNPSDSRHIA